MGLRVWSSDGKRVVEIGRYTVAPNVLYDDLLNTSPVSSQAGDVGPGLDANSPVGSVGAASIGDAP